MDLIANDNYKQKGLTKMDPVKYEEAVSKQEMASSI